MKYKNPNNIISSKWIVSYNFHSSNVTLVSGNLPVILVNGMHLYSTFISCLSFIHSQQLSHRWQRIPFKCQWPQESNHQLCTYRMTLPTSWATAVLRFASNLYVLFHCSDSLNPNERHRFCHCLMVIRLCHSIILSFVISCIPQRFLTLHCCPCSKMHRGLIQCNLQYIM